MPWSPRVGLDLLFPPRCLSCRQRGAFLCRDCIGRIDSLPDPFCPSCRTVVDPGSPRCRCQRPAPAFVIAGGTFEGPLRAAVHAFKYQGQRAGAPALAALLAPRARDVLQPGDHIVPVPLHRRREAARGYNQSALLAKALARHLDADQALEPMIRVRDTPRQVGLDREARRRNVQDAFTADPALCRGRSIMLVDDVCTTGATLSAAAEAVLQAGAERVYAVVLARALPGRDR
jgi:ComF family protein